MAGSDDKGQINQHKLMAMGSSSVSNAHAVKKREMARGGMVPMKTGIPLSPIVEAKRENGIPGLKKGGRSKSM